MKVALVFGGRDYTDRMALYHVLTEEAPDLVITGDATGADAFARTWADENKVMLLVGYADWEKYGYAAGPLRNTDLANILNTLKHAGYETFGISCPGGKGTSDMRRRVEGYRIPIRNV